MVLYVINRFIDYPELRQYFYDGYLWNGTRLKTRQPWPAFSR